MQNNNKHVNNQNQMNNYPNQHISHGNTLVNQPNFNHVHPQNSSVNQNLDNS